MHTDKTGEVVTRGVVEPASHFPGPIAAVSATTYRTANRTGTLTLGTPNAQDSQVTIQIGLPADEFPALLNVVLAPCHRLGAGIVPAQLPSDQRGSA